MSEQLRQTILAEQQIQATKKRFGLFSQPPPLAIGDDSAYKKKPVQKGQDGKPITSPPQLLSGQCRTGKMKSSFINAPQTIYQKDPYIDTFKRDIQYQRKMHTRSNYHQTQFKPASGSKTLCKPAYNYLEEKVDTKKQIKKDQNGRVKTQPRNFTTNPISKVQNQFFKPNKHIPDPYNRQKQIQKQQHAIWKSKLQQNTWKSGSHGNNTFQKIKSAFGLDQTAKKIMSQKKQRRIHTQHSVNHEGAFKPSVRGHGDPISRYPKYMPPKVAIDSNRKSRIKTESAAVTKDKWKHNTYNFTKPCPSVLLNPKNININRSRYK